MIINQQNSIGWTRTELTGGDLLELGVPHEAEGDGAVGEGLVDVGDNGEAGLDALAVLGVKEDLADLGAIDAALDALANNLGGVEEVDEDVLEDGGGGAGALDLLELVDVVGALGDLAGGNEDDLGTGELLLELVDEDLLDLADDHEEAEGVKDDEGLLAGGELELLGGVDVEAADVLAEGLVVELKVEEGLGDGILGGGSLGLLALKLAELAEVGDGDGHA